MTAIDPAFESLLAEPHVAVLATNRRSGYPLLTPIWYLYEDGRFYVTTNRRTAKAHNILRDPKVSLCIDSKQLPYKGVVVDGTAELRDDSDGAWTLRVFTRYLGPEGGREYHDRMMALPGRVLVIITPARLHTWDFS